MKMQTITAILITLSIFSLPTEPMADEGDDVITMPLVVEVHNRLYPDFYEVHRITMNERVFIGDTDYSFEVVGFYPHFAIVEVDSTKTIKSLSDEPKNVAFKIQVYENDEPIRTAWSFYTIQIPHFARDEYLTFDVIEFEYQGKLFSKGTTKEEI